MRSPDSQGQAQPAAALSGAEGDARVRWGLSSIFQRRTKEGSQLYRKYGKTFPQQMGFPAPC